ncbi:MAG TPA: EVE domain-containing protein [Kofleriaceae bacterium]|nr:EVE domain-containing protein [Kofleriaceae bacterium]
MPNYWLMKTEPDTFSIDDLERVKVEPWTGVRSVFARFHMRNMSVGDEVLFYHSSCEPPGVAGLARVVQTKVIDETQFDPQSKYFDEKATREKPIWDCVAVEFVEKLPYLVSLPHIRAEPALKDMKLLQIGRLSVMPVAEAEYKLIALMGHVEPKPLPVQKKVARPKVKAKPKAAKAAKTAKKRLPTPAKKHKR